MLLYVLINLTCICLCIMWY